MCQPWRLLASAPANAAAPGEVACPASTLTEFKSADTHHRRPSARNPGYRQTQGSTAAAGITTEPHTTCDEARQPLAANSVCSLACMLVFTLVLTALAPAAAAAASTRLPRQRLLLLLPRPHKHLVTHTPASAPATEGTAGQHQAICTPARREDVISRGRMRLDSGAALLLRRMVVVPGATCCHAV